MGGAGPDRPLKPIVTPIRDFPASLRSQSLWNNGTTDAERGGSTLYFPKVERLHSTGGGFTLATRTILLNMQPDTQGSSRQISNVSTGPDDKLYVHMGDGFAASTAPMQVFVGDHFPMIAAHVQCDVDGIPKGCIA